MNIVVLDGYSLNPGDLSWASLSDLAADATGAGGFTCYDYTPPDRIIHRSRDAEAVFVNSTAFPREAIDACKNLKYIGLLATGFDRVDIVRARERGIPVTNAPGYGTMAVAQHALALLLEITNRVGYFDKAMRRGVWTALGDAALFDHPLIELAGKTCGVVGFGSIGSAFARMAAALGMRVLANRSAAGMKTPPGIQGVEYATLDRVFAESDVISLHTPATPETMGMINSSSISAMKPGVILINASRGKLVGEDDLAAALHSGRVFAYGADVMSVEPARMDSPLFAAPNCYLTPHLAWVAREARVRLLDIVVANFKAFLDGGGVNVVN